ncbi:MAG: tetratricopeptide repeat protein [Bacteroidales bacterium]|nr:tetratricopeptide repeat protein [Bacteroidales bacterium]MCF8391725.1 tetratricopeptide repeat protein [Bacteroidales bacterium]
MKISIWHWRLLILIFLLMFASVAQAEVVSKTKTDSLREALNINRGDEKIATQLNLALEIIENQKEEAMRLAIASLSEARNAGNRTLEMRSYYVIGRVYQEETSLVLSQAYYDSALIISNEISNNWYKGEILYHIGANYRKKGDIIQALEYYSNALQPCRLSDNFMTMGSAYSSMGTIFRVNGAYDKAIEYIIKSKMNYEKAHSKDGKAWATYLLGRIHKDLGLPQKAREYFEEALKIYNELAALDGKRIGEALCHEQLGLLNLETGNFNEAINNIEYTLEIHSESGSKYGLSNAYKHMGNIEYSRGNYELSEQNLNKALLIKNEINDLYTQPDIYMCLGLGLIKRGDIDEGFNKIYHGLELAQTNNQTKLQLNIYSNLAETYLSLGDYEKSIFYQNKQIEAQKLILSGAASIKMEQLQAIYEIDEKNNQIEKLESQNEINYLSIRQQKTSQIIMLIGIILALLISAIIFQLYNKIRLKNRALKEVNATKDKLFSIIAHDLRGPIGASFGLSEILVEGIRKNNLSAVEKQATAIHQSLNDINNLLNNLLEWALSQLQRIKFNPRELNLLVVLHEVMDLLSFQAIKKNITLEINVKRTQQVFADEDMLKTIIRNLISNAIKFSNENKKVIISSDVKNKLIEISVKDYGVGMEPKLVDSLFSIETNTKKPGTSGERGTGLGLILVKEFVEKHGGDIKVKSEVGQGSVFSFTLGVK